MRGYKDASSAAMTGATKLNNSLLLLRYTRRINLFASTKEQTVSARWCLHSSSENHSSLPYNVVPLVCSAGVDPASNIAVLRGFWRHLRP